MTRDAIFVPYSATLDLLSVKDAMDVCEQVYLMHARNSVVLSNPPSFKLDVADDFHNHWHVKSVFLSKTCRRLARGSTTITTTAFAIRWAGSTARATSCCPIR